MTVCTGADLDQLLELRRVLGRRADDIDGGAFALRRALEQFRDGSTAFVPSIPPHGARGMALAERLDDLGRRVAGTRDALAAADRWAGTAAASWLVARQGEHATVVDARHASAELWARWRRSAVAGDDVGDVARHSFLLDDVAQHFAGAAWRTQLADSIADVDHVLGRGASSFRAAGATGRVGRAVERFRATRAGSVTRLGGRALGVVGIAAGGVDAYRGWRAGDEEQAVTGVLSAAAGIAVMSGFPPAQLAGAVVSAGLLVYEYREEIGNAVRAAGRATSAAARAAASFVDGLF